MVEIKGGDKLEARLRQLAAQIEKPGTLSVGFLEGATYPDGTPVAMIAAIQNFGAPRRGIPPRPFFSNFVKDGAGHWGDDIATLLKATDYDSTKTLEALGPVLDGELKDTIVNGTYAPLAPATVQRKGFAKTLIDTGTMLNAVNHKVDST